MANLSIVKLAFPLVTITSHAKQSKCPLININQIYIQYIHTQVHIYICTTFGFVALSLLHYTANFSFSFSKTCIGEVECREKDQTKPHKFIIFDKKPSNPNNIRTMFIAIGHTRWKFVMTTNNIMFFQDHVAARKKIPLLLML